MVDKKRLKYILMDFAFFTKNILSLKTENGLFLVQKIFC
jgi:hypothetical protein